MLIALLTDIHANREALDACLADAERIKPDRYIFLGDYVGYGADPGYAVDVVRRHVERGAVALRGNHDDAVLASAAGMNDAARRAIEWTRQQLDAEQRDFIAALPFTFEGDDSLFVHANAVAPHRWDYVTDAVEAERSLAATHCRRVFCGHLHVPGVYYLAADGRVGEVVPVAETPIPLLPERRWLAVLGAVGQPRDGNPDASYALFDGEGGELIYLRVAYDAAKAAQKILDAGLPPRLGARLLYGL